jgi:endonuclease/exonuclease/phosphatase family metal-dependent hydrolase
VGEPSGRRAPRACGTLRLATYNIHACVGGDGRLAPERVAEVIRELDADVVALQELEQHPVGEGREMLRYLADVSDMEPIAGITLKRETRGYGNALLTRLPVERINRVDISIPGREPRGALDVVLDCGDRTLQVVVTHLGLRPGERRLQIRRVLPLFESQTCDLAVLMGDLNEWMLWGRPLRWLRRHFPPTPDIRTWPAKFPLFALDQFLLRPRSALKSLAAHRSRMARIASDHLPIVAEVVP